jgi:hypothetical protein
MLGVSTYTCRAQVAAQLASYRKIQAAKPSGIDAFERQFFNHMILALDHYFMHRLRNREGKDGNPLNEVRMLSNAIMKNKGRMSADETIRCKPDMSILKSRRATT